MKIGEQGINQMSDPKTETMCPCGNGTIPENHIDEFSYGEGWKGALEWLSAHVKEEGYDFLLDEQDGIDAMVEKMAELNKK